MNALKNKRKELGLTQIQAAKACGVSRRTYQTYEETNNLNSTYDELIQKLNDIGVLDGDNYILNVKYIKSVCRRLFKEKYPEIECAYLFGSYARDKATGKSDVDLLVVYSTMDINLCEIIAELEQQLHKKVDLYTDKELAKNEKFIKQILIEGIKIYSYRTE